MQNGQQPLWLAARLRYVTGFLRRDNSREMLFHDRFQQE
jgi:hypothetical protein